MTVCSLSLQISPASKNRARESPVMRAPSPYGQVSLLSFPLVMGIALCFVWIFFESVWFWAIWRALRTLDRPPCCVVNAIILYTLIHSIIPNTAHAQMVDYLRVGRAMFCHAILITRIPWLVQVLVHHATRSRRSWAHFRLPRRKNFKTRRQWR